MYVGLHQFDESLVDPDGEVGQDLAVLGQVKVPQTVLRLSRRVGGQERLQHTASRQREGASWRAVHIHGTQTAWN